MLLLIGFNWRPLCSPPTRTAGMDEEKPPLPSDSATLKIRIVGKEFYLLQNEF